ncbi:MAG: hypothetical protein ABS918_11145, partial [Saccharopolyspora rectivirgula]
RCEHGRDRTTTTGGRDSAREDRRPVPVRCGEYLCVPATAGGIRVFGADYLFDLEKSRMGNPEGHRARGGATPRSSAAGGTAPRTATGT